MSKNVPVSYRIPAGTQRQARPKSGGRTNGHPKLGLFTALMKKSLNNTDHVT